MTHAQREPLLLKNPLAESGNGYPRVAEFELRAPWINELRIDYDDPGVKEGATNSPVSWKIRLQVE